MTRCRIICTGNRLIPADEAGMLVYDELCSRTLPAGLEVIAGGLGGLDLLPFFSGCAQVILVDRVVGCAAPGTVVHLDKATLCALEGDDYGHSGGLSYLLKTLPHLGIEPLPRIDLIGIEGTGEVTTIHQAADLALEVAHALL
jgi:hydrogenase maturation protease